jgi:nucleoside-diphosphate-sugar epimerase
MALCRAVAARETIVIIGSGALAHDVVRALVAESAERRVVVVEVSKSGTGTHFSRAKNMYQSPERHIDPSSPSCARELCDLLLELRPGVLALLALSESPVTPAEPWISDVALTTAVTSALSRLLELGGRAPHLLLLSSTAVYGVAPGSPLVFDEQSALPRETVFSSACARWAQELRNCERMIVAWAVGAEAGVGVLRTASVLGGSQRASLLAGPAGPQRASLLARPMDSPLAAMLRAPFPVRVLGYDPPCQVVHYDDLVRAVALAIDQRCGEVLNIVGRAVVPLSRVFAMAGVVAPPVPGPIADRVAPAATDGAHLRWRTLADGRRATALLGFQPQKSLEDCFCE